MEHGLGPDHWRGRGELDSTDGLITLVVDYGDEDYYIDAKPGYTASAMRTIIAQARVRGLELMDEFECEPEILEDGTVRVYLALAVQPALQPVQEKRRQSAARRMTFAFALAASVAAALLLPSPLRYDYVHQQSNWKRDHPNHTHTTWQQDEQVSYKQPVPEEKGH